MQRIILYIILVFILFSGYNQLKSIWQENEKDLDDTYSQVKEGIFSWYKNATDTSIEVKEKLNEKIQQASDQYEKIKSEIDTTTNRINEKRAQLDQTLKEMEEAKKALDALLEKDKEVNTESTVE